MSNNCLVTKLKANIQNDNLPYLDKGVILYDSTIGDAEAARNTYSTILLEGLSDIENIDTTILEYSSVYLRVKSGTTVPSNYSRKMFYKLDEITKIQSNFGTSSTSYLSKYKMRIVDLVRCKNIESLAMIGLQFIDEVNPNIEELSVLTKCYYYNIIGPTYATWIGDLVNFADRIIANGLNISDIPAIAFVTIGGASGTVPLQLTCNGSKIYTDFGRNIWIEFPSEGHYNIYKNVTESDPKGTRATGELIYSK